VELAVEEALRVKSVERLSERVSRPVRVELPEGVVDRVELGEALPVAIEVEVRETLAEALSVCVEEDVLEAGGPFDAVAVELGDFEGATDLVGVFVAPMEAVVVRDALAVFVRRGVLDSIGELVVVRVAP
jgi:hypothetical protein